MSEKIELGVGIVIAKEQGEGSEIVPGTLSEKGYEGEHLLRERKEAKVTEATQRTEKSAAKWLRLWWELKSGSSGEGHRWGKRTTRVTETRTARKHTAPKGVRTSRSTGRNRERRALNPPGRENLVNGKRKRRNEESSHSSRLQGKEGNCGPVRRGIRGDAARIFEPEKPAEENGGESFKRGGRGGEIESRWVAKGCAKRQTRGRK